jgi:hypothetical protein
MLFSLHQPVVACNVCMVLWLMCHLSFERHLRVEVEGLCVWVAGGHPIPPGQCLSHLTFKALTRQPLLCTASPKGELPLMIAPMVC